MGATQLRHRVLTAAAMAAQAITDTEQPPDGRLQTLMDAHGRILAARGPTMPLTFSALRDLLTGDLARLLTPGPSGRQPPSAQRGELGQQRVRLPLGVRVGDRYRPGVPLGELRGDPVVEGDLALHPTDHDLALRRRVRVHAAANFWSSMISSRAVNDSG
jgi:hypothetical protein